MIKILIIIAVVYFVHRTIKSALLQQGGNPGGEKDHQGPGSDDVMIKCAQCGVYFPQRDGISLRKGSETLYFCSEKCRGEYK